MMTNGDPKGQFFLSYPHTNNGFFFLLTTVLFIYLINLFIYSFIYLECHDYANMQFHMMTLLEVLGKIAWVRSEFLSQGKISDILIWCARIFFLPFQYFRLEPVYGRGRSENQLPFDRLLPAFP